MMESAQLEIFDGLLLSDGSLLYDKHRNSRFQAQWKHRRTAELVVEALPSLSISGPRCRTLKPSPTCVKDEYTAWYVWSARLPQLTEQRKRWYPNGKKIVPRDTVLTPLTCYWWYVGDGSLWSDGKFSLHTNGFTMTDVEFLVDQLRQLGLHPKIREYGNGPYIEFPRSDQDLWFSYIGLCHNPEYGYRWAERFK